MKNNTKKIRPYFNVSLIFLCLLSFVFFSSCYDEDKDLFSLPQIPDDSVFVTKIWDNDKYCSFTSLVKYKGEYYCAFREGKSHAGDKGCIRIIKSLDAKNWKEAYFLSLSGYDLRDPNFSVMPDGRLMLICGRQTISDTQTVVSFLADKDAEFTAFQEAIIPEEIKDNSNWIWRAKWFDDQCYAVRYGDGHTDLLKSYDGVNWDFVTTISISQFVSEVQLERMSNGDMVALARIDSTRYNNGFVCYSKYPYESWTVRSSNIVLQGQSYLVTLNDKIICASRSFFGENERVTLYCSVTENSFARLYDLPSGGKDVGYAGMIVDDDNVLVSYHSCHNSYCDIYLAVIPCKCFINRGILF